MAPEAPPREGNREGTRQALIDAAVSVFADQGYAAGSVRAITQLARANQAAITYHFGGKEGLYRAVLRTAVDELEAENTIDERLIATMDREEALRLVIRQFLIPLSQPQRLGRYMRIFGREGLDPSSIYLAFFETEKPKLVSLAEILVRRFLPENAAPRDVALTTFWLLQQPIAFVRSAGRLRQPPFSVSFDVAAIDEVADLLVRLVMSGLGGRRA
ncbi:TetR/AcrR family transcriptional regulator [Lichenifustis flavocetrariae]|uniref:CerR family C-terminal domain-containing protein n=1 Tax=Lichenifustis flavocetrariae TaxID=2949735 RepID=A0AA42CGY7_9HYPH|nr:CerR family C-terminal domain-containing protein [Lichenifustis flavocetrariae]MCW6507038.1 CerR family C-terminal domain-containing protein [Lichenifustis flavocetrariae]